MLHLLLENLLGLKVIAIVCDKSQVVIDLPSIPIDRVWCHFELI